MLLFLAAKMRIDRSGFNHFLRVAIFGLIVAGCSSTPEDKQTKKDKKDASQIQIYREAVDFSGRAAELGSIGVNTAKVGRRDPKEVSVQRDPVLDERDVKQAQVIEQADGSFSIGIEFTSHGSLVLHQSSAAVQGGHLVIAGRWSDGTNVVNRWLGAPLMRRPLDKGAIVFTPDLSHEEAVLFVRGLNNVAIKLENQTKPAKPKKKKEKEEVKPNLDFNPFLTQ